MPRFYNTASGQIEVFKPFDPEHVKMYVCGPTVYSRPHIGNARPRVIFDVLAKVLKSLYPKVTYAANITDVDDKINKAAHESSISIYELTEKMTAHYHSDMRALNCSLPDIEIKATDAIPQMIECIQSLIDKKYAYVADNHVLFSVKQYEHYGALSKRQVDEQIEGARVQVADYKRDPADFVLWKPSKAPDPFWESPWGNGRPGWHIECTAMVANFVGLPLDIHGGGIDLLFPHHENESAQGCCAYQVESYCKLWMHNGLINVDQTKMSKSIGNILLIDDLLREIPGEAIRYLILSTHYRKPLDWTDDKMRLAFGHVKKLHQALASFKYDATKAVSPDTIIQILSDDLNTPKAINQIQTWVKSSLAGDEDAFYQLHATMPLLGLGVENLNDWYASVKNIDITWIDEQVRLRTDAKQKKDFTKADAIRQSLMEKGIIVEDSSSGSTWRWE